MQERLVRVATLNAMFLAPNAMWFCFVALEQSLSMGCQVDQFAWGFESTLTLRCLQFTHPARDFRWDLRE
jgi:hypothetical protein